jgi:hypothetical protein
MLLFFYGSLMDRDLLSIALGRDVSTLGLLEATVDGFICRRAAGKAYPILLTQRGSRAEGILVSGFNYIDIDRLSYYESEDYVLQLITVQTKAGPYQAKFFQPTRKLGDSGESWTLKGWQYIEKSKALIVARQLMQYYGYISRFRSIL